MEYMVIGADGKEYGPANTVTLAQWAAEGRIQRASQLRDFSTGQVVAAGNVAGIFPHQAPGSTMPMGDLPQSQYKDPADNGALIGVILRSVAAVVLFFFLKGLGLIFAGYALYYAIQAKSNGNRHGTVAIVIAAIALAVVGIGWLMRLNGAQI